MENTKTTLEVGDKIRIKNWATDYIVVIERVTKTLAMGRCEDHKHVEYRFKRNIGSNGKVWPQKREKWDTTQRTLIKPEEK